MSKYYIGAEFVNAEGSTYKIIGKSDESRYWFVEFASGYRTVAKEPNILYGKVKDYYYRSVYGVGYLGAKIAKPKGSFERAVYDLWANMLRRVYGMYHDHWNGDYTGVQVCPSWHNYCVFREDIKYLEGYEAWVNDSRMCLDKDLSGCRLYSKSTCKFITNAENLSEASNRRWGKV